MTLFISLLFLFAASLVRLPQLNEFRCKTRRVSLSNGHMMNLASIYHHLGDNTMIERSRKY